jgi:hypothetical protein
MGRTYDEDFIARAAIYAAKSSGYISDHRFD